MSEDNNAYFCVITCSLLLCLYIGYYDCRNLEASKDSIEDMTVRQPNLKDNNTLSQSMFLWYVVVELALLPLLIINFCNTV